MLTGIIKFFNQDKGTGLIKPDEGGDVFIIIEPKSIVDYDKLVSGQTVKFEMQVMHSGHMQVTTIAIV